MKNSLKFSVLLLTGGLSACAVAPPTAPSIAAMPGAGKNFDQFQADDAACRAFASTRVPAGAAQVASQNSAGTALGGAALGAGAGALIGSTAAAVGTGAAVGAGVGLLAGGLVAANNAGASAQEMQYSYNVAYAQCMSAKGEQVPNAASFASGGPLYGYPYPYYYGYPGYYGYWGYPGFAYYGGWGWHAGWGWRGRWR